jgi:hypothetical protein
MPSPGRSGTPPRVLMKSFHFYFINEIKPSPSTQMEKVMSRPASGDDEVLMSAREAIASAQTVLVLRIG